ncbi:uncharacterized protein BX664DRAFT_336385 [Halteromyces radiatus]|uniref:uncharacterized protein n=1 Tax=Halteromyces radiatus TaxID=101107 RepID=UPI00221FA0B9|nr:uncharacterized protein BX664DRAFT_336385 [Halteromyces radiatus]KAI8086637.1 hypothetical protein BX664DRAFT_336385 [Halteromyces radiatus]
MYRLSSTLPNHDKKAGDSSSSRNKVNKLITTFVQNQSIIETTNGIPHARLLENLFATPLIDHIMDTCDFDEQQIWSLAALLFGHRKDDSHRRLKNWLRSTVLEEMQKEGIDLALTSEDPWQRAFHYMSSGQVIQACELIQQLGDDALVAMLVVHFQEQEDVDIHQAAQEQILFWQQQDRFDSLPLYQRKMWYCLQGQLGYVDHLKAVVTEGLSWPQSLLLYILYHRDYRTNLASALMSYSSLTNLPMVGLHQLRTKKHTAQVPSRCLWYCLLQWWASSKNDSMSSLRLTLEERFPLHCRWLLLIHDPSFFINDLSTCEAWKRQWTDELYQNGLEYMAILSALYMSSPESTIRQLLSMREWDKEHYLVRQLQIPSEWVTDAKAVYAYNHHMYDKEVDYYLEANETDKARHAILNHMIPAIFLKDDQSDTMINYLEQLMSLSSDDMTLQQTIHILRNIYIILRDYPHRTHEIDTMKTNLTLAVQNLAILQKAGYITDPMFYSKLAGQLMTVASTFMNNDDLNTLLETCPVEIHSNLNMMELLSRAMTSSIANQ